MLRKVTTVRIAENAFRTNIERTAVEPPPGRSVDQLIDATAVATKTRGRLHQIIYDAVAVEVNGNAFNRRDLVVFKADRTANVRRHTDRSCALRLETPGRFRRSLGISYLADDRRDARENQDESHKPPLALT
jgi:hypothetical protein